MGEPESQAGRVLGGRFRLESLLGEGGFGTIWRAEQLVLGATVAVKLIDLSIARQPGALERFLREAQAAASLRSPHVVQILDYGVEGDQPFIAMELLEGENLAQRLHRVGRLAPSEALRIVTHVARAISRAHESNIVHRDLKPENVFLVRNEDDEVAKVLDFGVAKIKNPVVIDESTQTRTGSLIGTPHYMSPEQVQGNKTVDFRTDIWAIGVIAYEMFTGQRPFTGNALGDLVLQICIRDVIKPSQLAPVPVGFDKWFACATDRDPDKRFQSARDLAQALREVVGGGDRDTSLIVSENMIEAAERDGVSISAIVPSENASRDAASGLIELAETIFSPASNPSAAETDVQSPAPQPAGDITFSVRSAARESNRKLTLSVLIGFAGLCAVGAGVWYQSAKHGGGSKTNLVRPSPNASVTSSTSADVQSAHPVDSQDIAAAREKIVPTKRSQESASTRQTKRRNKGAQADASIPTKASAPLAQPDPVLSATEAHEPIPEAPPVPLP
jgi:serine/threonine protein kinase